MFWISGGLFGVSAVIYEPISQSRNTICGSGHEHGGGIGWAGGDYKHAWEAMPPAESRRIKLSDFGGGSAHGDVFPDIYGREKKDYEEIPKKVGDSLQGAVETFHETSLPGGTATVNLRNVSAGVYVLRVTDAEGHGHHRKIVRK